MRNFSRGWFSPVYITLKIHTEDISRTIKLMERLNLDSMNTKQNLIEAWQVINVTSEIGQITELTLLANARCG